jgi:uncharacterized glyoxalase superfamily protein PhnB
MSDTRPRQPPAGYPQITPYLAYENERAAIAWLQHAFGFRLKHLIEDEKGAIVHCELDYGAGSIGIGNPDKRARSPQSAGGAYSSSFYVFVDDVDAHFARAKAAGAKVIRELRTMEYGDRTYGCEDLEGHPWFFGTRVDEKAWEAANQGH